MQSFKSSRALRRLGLVALFLCVFAIFFAIGYLTPGLSLKTDSTTSSFTSADQEQIVEEIQSHFTETISYQCEEASELITNDEGTSYYTITYLVCVPNADQVYVYLYYKFVTDSEEYQAGDLVCMMTTISNTLTKDDLFPNGL